MIEQYEHKFGDKKVTYILGDVMLTSNLVSSESASSLYFDRADPILNFPKAPKKVPERRHESNKQIEKMISNRSDHSKNILSIIFSKLDLAIVYNKSTFTYIDVLQILYCFYPFIILRADKDIFWIIPLYIVLYSKV